MNDRYLYKGKIKGNLTGHKELDWAIGNLIVEQSTGKHFIIDLSHFNESTRLCDTVIEVDPSTICQCTGLKDKNGKLIWENDILLGHLDDLYPENTTYERVLWNNNGFCTQEHCSVDVEPLDEFDQNNFEVCGNIFDNPELLEVGE